MSYWFDLSPRFPWVNRWDATRKRKFVRRGKTKHQRHMARQASRS